MSDGEGLGPAPVAPPAGGYTGSYGGYKAGPGYSTYSGGMALGGAPVGMTTRQYSNAVLVALTTRRAWGVFWAIQAFFALLVFVTAAATPVKFDVVNFAIVCGLFNLILGVGLAYLYLQPSAGLQQRANGFALQYLKTERNHHFALLGFLIVHFIFWLSLSASYRWAPLVCGLFATSYCALANATLAFAVLTFFMSFWNLVAVAMDFF